jgi:transposase
MLVTTTRDKDDDTDNSWRMVQTVIHVDAETENHKKRKRAPLIQKKTFRLRERPSDSVRKGMLVVDDRERKAFLTRQRRVNEEDRGDERNGDRVRSESRDIK